MIRQTCIAIFVLGAAQPAAADVGVALNFAQPGLYGSVGIGAFPPPVYYAPPVAYAPPVLVASAPWYVAAQPVYYPGWYGAPYGWRRGHWHEGHGHEGHGHEGHGHEGHGHEGHRH